MYEQAPHPIGAALARAPISSRSGRRTRPRVSMPMVAEIAGKAYHARDWSAGGLTLHADGPILEVGQDVAMRLRFELPEGCHVVELGGQVLRTLGRQAHAFRFLGSTHHAELERIAQSWLTGEAGHPHEPAQPAALAMPSVPTPLPIRLPALPAPPPAAAPAWVRVQRVALAALGVGAVACAAAYVITTRLTVYSDYAAVTGDLQIVRAAASGMLAGSALKPGATLHAGQVVGRLEPAVTPVALAQLAAALKVAHAQVDKQKGLLDSLQAGHDGFADFAQQALREAAAIRQMHEERCWRSSGSTVACVRSPSWGGHPRCARTRSRSPCAPSSTT